MEETCTPMNLQVLENVRNRSAVPQAGGERVYGKYHYANLIKKDIFQIYQPDLGTCGGITEAMKIASMADAVDAGIQISPFESQERGDYPGDCFRSRKNEKERILYQRKPGTAGTGTGRRTTQHIA